MELGVVQEFYYRGFIFLCDTKIAEFKVSKTFLFQEFATVPPLYFPFPSHYAGIGPSSAANALGHTTMPWLMIPPINDFPVCKSDTAIEIAPVKSFAKKTIEAMCVVSEMRLRRVMEMGTFIEGFATVWSRPFSSAKSETDRARDEENTNHFGKRSSDPGTEQRAEHRRSGRRKGYHTEIRDEWSPRG